MIKFLTFADLHYDYATQGDERIRQILDRAKSEKVDFIVSLGDITAPFIMQIIHVGICIFMFVLSLHRFLV